MSIDEIEKIDLSKVDWKSSRDFFQSLEDDLRNLDEKDERYDFTWVGKRKAIIEAGSPINKTLRPDVKNSKNWETTENLYIEGDNLDALKLLQESYLGKVKMIYIDPPYNTGNNLVYKNDFSIDIKTYQIKEGSVNEYGENMQTNMNSNGRFHSDWCSMFYSRIKVCRNLLADDGFFVCAMDESEIANTIKICDDVFGEENRLSVVTVVHKPEGRNQEKFFGSSNEYALFYAKNILVANFNNVVLDSELEKNFKETDSKGNFKYKNFIRLTDGKYALREAKPNFYYPIYVSSDLTKFSLEEESGYSVVLPITDSGIERTWKTLPSTFEDLVRNDNIVAKKEGDKISIYEKLRESQVIKTHWIKKEYHSYHYGTKIVNELLGGKFFDFPKSVHLLIDILKLTTSDSDLILDFFSGSATMAHAVLQLNAEDIECRKFIMVQLPELTDEKSEAYKAGYKNICEIGRERIRRAGDKITKEYPESKVDIGFRSLVIADTNYKEVNKSVDQTSQEELLSEVDNIKDYRTPLDLLFGVLLQLALELNRPLESREIDGNTVYLYDYLGEVSGLVACFTNNLSEATIKTIASLKPLIAVFKDSSFSDSQAKINLSEHFKVLSPDTKLKVI